MIVVIAPSQHAAAVALSATEPDAQETVAVVASWDATAWLYGLEHGLEGATLIVVPDAPWEERALGVVDSLGWRCPDCGRGPNDHVKNCSWPEQ